MLEWQKLLSLLINQVSQLVGVEKFYLKVGELLYNKGGMISDGVVAGKRIDEHVVERDEKHRRVINPSVGELVAMLGQVDELQEVQQRYMTKRIIEGTPAEIAKKEAEGITPDIKEQIIADITRKLQIEGASQKEIEQVLKNEQMEKLLESSRALQAENQLLGIRIKAIGGKPISNVLCNLLQKLLELYNAVC